MAGATLTTYDSALKEDYQPAIRSQLNEEIMMLAQVEKNTEDFEGRRAVLSLHVGRNSGVGARLENGTLPTAGAQDYAEERVNVRGQYGRIQLSGWLIDGSRSNAGSFARALKQENDRLVNDMKRNLNRQVFGDGTGAIASAQTSGPSTTVTLDTTTTLVQMQQFHQGMVIDIGTVAEAAAGTGGPVYGATISSIDESAKTFVTSSVTTDNADFVFVAGSGGALGTTQREITGLQAIVASSGTLFNVVPTTDLSWVSYVSSNSGTNRALSESMVNTALHSVYRKGGKYPNFIVASDGVYRAYENLLLSAKRFSNTTKLNGGHSALTVNAGDGEVSVVWDKDCPYNSMYLLNTEHLIEFVYEDWGWMDQDGAVLSRVANTHAYEAVFYKLHELTTDKRNAHGLISDITTG